MGLLFVIPAQAGIQAPPKFLDSGSPPPPSRDSSERRSYLAINRQDSKLLQIRPYVVIKRFLGTVESKLMPRHFLRREDRGIG